MSMPNVPDITPDITLTADQCLAMLVASIALEEMGQAHLINAEAEKLQYILGTLDGTTPPEPPTLDQLVEVSNSIGQTMRNVIKNQMLLSFKLEDALNLYNQG